MSYARVLVEIDLLEDLQHSVEISLPEGLTLHQKVVYETLLKFCNLCCVLGHSRLLYPKATTANNKGPSSQPHVIANWVLSYKTRGLPLHKCKIRLPMAKLQWFLG